MAGRVDVVIVHAPGWERDPGMARVARGYLSSFCTYLNHAALNAAVASSRVAA